MMNPKGLAEGKPPMMIKLSLKVPVLPKHVSFTCKYAFCLRSYGIPQD